MACCTLNGRLVTLMASFIILLFYMLLGAALFKAIELPHERNTQRITRQHLQQSNESASEDIQNLTYQLNASACIAAEAVGYYKIKDDSNDEDELRWTYTKSLMFAFTTMATLGYGDLVPTTHIGKGMSMLFALTTIPIYYMMVMLYARHGITLLDSLIERYTTDVNKTTKLRYLILHGLLAVLGLVFAAIYSIEHRANFGDALWYTFSTFTTIGFGDFVPSHNSIHMFYFLVFVTFVYVVIGMLVLIWKDTFFKLHGLVEKYSNGICSACCNISLHHGAILQKPGMSRLQEEEPIEEEMEAVEFDPAEEEERENNRTQDVFA